MLVCSSTKTVLYLRGHFEKRTMSHMCNMASVSSSNSRCFMLKHANSPTKRPHITVRNIRSWRLCPSLNIRSSVNLKGSLETMIGSSPRYQSGSLRISVPKRGVMPLVPYLKFNTGPFSWLKGNVTACLISVLLVCYSTSDSAHAETSKKGVGVQNSSTHSSQGKKVYTDYSVIGIPGDGRCLFRSVAHGACLRSGKPTPNDKLQKELADELRSRVADEFNRRRQETEWFIEGDFDTYVSQIRKPHVWGGEPELLMLSHVLKMPITVYMRDNKHGGLISIAEYGQEYGEDNPIRVLYHGYGHYDALLIPGRKGTVSRL